MDATVEWMEGLRRVCSVLFLNSVAGWGWAWGAAGPGVKFRSDHDPGPPSPSALAAEEARRPLL